MPSGATVRIVGLGRVKKVLGADFKPAMRGASERIANEIKKEIAPYPSASIANSPSEQQWYERGYGPRWRRKDGGIGGHKTSETLGDRWAVRTKGIGAILGNIASYAPFVHSKEKQARFHGKRGWVTDEQAIEKVQKAGTIKKVIVDAMMHAMGQR